MWSHLIKLVSLSKGALVVGIAASAAMVSNAEFSNSPSHVEQPAASAIVAASPTALRPANSPSSLASPNVSEVPAVQLPSSAPSISPQSTSLRSNDSGKPELSGVVKECLTKYAAVRLAGDSASQGDRQSASSVCKAAIEQSGLTSAEFAATYGFDKLPTATTTTNDITALVKDCFEKYTAKDPGASDACKKAIAASGLSSNDFFAKYGTPARPSTDAQPTTTPTTAPKTTVSAETYALIAKCFQLYTAISTTGDSRAASDACAAAIKASGMSSTDFWATFGKELTSTTKPTTKPEPTATAKPVTNTAELSQLVAKCLQLYAAIASTGDTHAASEACGAAIRASGMSSADFWAKYHPTTN
jgi:hypothetical protein